jgi:hypothetical protein
MQMQIGVAVRVGDFFIVDFTEPLPRRLTQPAFLTALM